MPTFQRSLLDPCISCPLVIVQKKFMSIAIGLWCVPMVASFERSHLVDPSSDRPVMDNAYPAICPYSLQSSTNSMNDMKK